MPIFGTNTCYLLTYLKIRKIEGGKISPPTHPSIHPSTHPRNKTFSRFQKRGFQHQKRRCPVPFLEHIIKWKDRQWTPSGSAFADSLRGIKHFGIFVSAAEIGVFGNLPGTNWIKYKILKWTPYGICFADSLRGIKHFQNFQKADNKAHFETTKYVSRTQFRIIKHK